MLRLPKQMVIKEEWWKKEQWDSNEEVRGVRPEGKVSGVRPEVKIMSKLNKKHCHAIPRLFNYKRYPLVWKHRLYMEYCPFRDLSGLRSRYNQFRFVTIDKFIMCNANQWWQ